MSQATVTTKPKLQLNHSDDFNRFCRSMAVLKDYYRQTQPIINPDDDFLTIGWCGGESDKVMEIAIDLATDEKGNFSLDGFMDFIKQSQTKEETAIEILWVLSPLFDDRFKTFQIITNNYTTINALKNSE